MLTSIDDFLRYFDGLARRTRRDVAALPPEADGWTPPVGEGERAWSINKIVGHICGSRAYFAHAYLGKGWISPPPPDASRRERWVPLLEGSAADLAGQLRTTPDDWLTRRIRMIDADGALSGWRILMMMAEHEVHHRSQLDTYAGLNGWDVPQIYGRSAEQIGDLQAAERAKHGREGGGWSL